MGKWCDGCGAWLEFRTIDGQRRPITPCACGPGGDSSTISSDRDHDPRFVGSRSLPWPTTYQTECWWCGESVLYHTNGYGDCVLFDLPLIPWQVHSCWVDHVDQRSQAAFAAGISLASRGFSDSDLSEGQNKDAIQKVKPQLWHSVAAISVDDELTVIASPFWTRAASSARFRSGHEVTLVGVVGEIDGLSPDGRMVRLRLGSGMVVLVKRHLANRYGVGSVLVARAVPIMVSGEWIFEASAFAEVR